MKRKVISLMLVIAMLFSMTITISASNYDEFTDMPDNWSKSAIQSAISNGLINGYNGKIMPDSNIKRAEIAAIINRAFGAYEKGDVSKFTDIASDKWYFGDMAKAVKMGTFKGEKSVMRPEDFVTRQEAFTIIARALKLTTKSFDCLNKFSDQSQISEWAKPEIAALVSCGYVNGRKENKDYIVEGRGETINPLANITRAEFAQLMHNIFKAYITESGKYTSDVTGNVLINVPEVTLEGIKINGDLIIGDGVGAGNVTLDRTIVAGRILVRGGGKNSIHITNGTTINGTVVIDNVNNEVRILTDKGTTVKKIEAGSQVILEGSFGEVKVIGEASSSAGVEIRGNVQTLMVEAKAEVTVTSGTIMKIEVAQTASGTTINASQGAKVETVVANAQTNIRGDGTVISVEANANGVKVDTSGTRVSVRKGITGVIAGGEEVSGGSTTNTTDSSITDSGGGSSGGSHIYNYLDNGCEGDYTISSAGTYGPETGTATVTGNVYIDTAGARLRNITITNDLIFGADIADGDSYIRNVTVQGRTLVQGGGSNSIHIQGTSTTGIIEVDDQREDQSEPINISAEGTGDITAVNVTSESLVKITPVTDTIGFVAAVDGSTITYGETDYKEALLDKIIENANTILDASISGTSDADIQFNPNLADLTAGIVDLSGEYAIWSLKYYINPLDGVDGYQEQYDTLEAKLQEKGLDMDLIDIRDNPEKFIDTMYDKWFPGQPTVPCLDLNQGMLNGLWDTYTRYLALKKYKVNESEEIEVDIGNTDDAETVTDFVYCAQTLYGNLKLLQNYSIIDQVNINDIDVIGPSAGDEIEIIFTRRLKPGDSEKGKDRITSLITGDSRFGTTAVVEWRDDTILSFYEEQFEVSKCTITLGDSPNANLFEDTLIIPKGELGSYVPEGFVEIGGQYGAYITDYEPIFDITVNFQ
ncbi:MAG: S-layer homology domain-containing protein [Ignavibacteriales bacterium]